MKQLLILSGKGGTGKTTLASAFIKLAKALAYADCDVDAPNLHLSLHQSSAPFISDYFGLPKAFIDPVACSDCDLCKQHCRFDAIQFNVEEQKHQIDLFSCEGCGVCERICPYSAISLQPVSAGKLFLYSHPHIFSSARLEMGSGATGKLVTAVKKQLLSEVSDKKVSLTIIDGSPGIGCPVIASLNGADLVLIVAEPSVSGMNDMERIIETAQKLMITVAVCVNKFNINLENTKAIENYCKRCNIAFAGTIPFDKTAVEAINKGKTIVDEDCAAGAAVKKVYKNIVSLLFDTML